MNQQIIDLFCSGDEESIQLAIEFCYSQKLKIQDLLTNYEFTQATLFDNSNNKAKNNTFIKRLKNPVLYYPNGAPSVYDLIYLKITYNKKTHYIWTIKYEIERYEPAESIDIYTIKTFE